MKLWFYRIAAAHFIVTAVTGLVLYFRPGGARPGLYSDAVKEWLVMIHNGEWMSFVLLRQPLFSGLVVGSVLAVTLMRFSARTLLRRNDAADVQATESPPIRP